MSAVPPYGAGWITPPIDDGASVWSSEEYSSPVESTYLVDSGYVAAGYAGHSSYSRGSRFGYPPSYPYYVDAANPADAATLPPYWPRPTITPALDGLAVAALVFGIIGGWIFGIGFGIAALNRIRRGERRGRGLALAGLWLSAAWIVIMAIAIAVRR